MELSNFLIAAGFAMVIIAVQFFLSRRKADNGSSKELLESKATLQVNAKEIEQKDKEIAELKEKIGKYETAYRNLINEDGKKEEAIKIKDKQLSTAEEAKKQADGQIKDLEAKISDISISLKVSEASVKASEDKLKTQRAEFEQLQKTAETNFKNIANEILEVKTKAFTETNKVNLDLILKPFNDKLATFSDTVNKTYQQEKEDQGKLQAHIETLVKQTNEVSAKATDLADALKNNKKDQGNWGESLLRTILEKSGMEKYYHEQQRHTDEDGKKNIPDVIIDLPNDKQVIIDSKVSLVNYLKYVEEPSDEAERIFINDIRNHIDELSDKHYSDLPDLRDKVYDYVIMFLPINPSFSIAMTAMWQYAYEKRILLINPPNLITCLHSISDLWAKEDLTKEAGKVKELAEKLLTDFRNFLGNLFTIKEDISEAKNSIDKAQKSFDNMIDIEKMEKSSLIKNATQLIELHIQPKKQKQTNNVKLSADTQKNIDKLLTPSKADAFELEDNSPEPEEVKNDPDT